MASPSQPPIAVSAPGKVLLAGGFLVLDRRHTGLVFGLDARIHVVVEELPTSRGVTLQEIVVRSPQFVSATWRYGYHSARSGGGILATQLQASDSNASPNPFVETALCYALSYVSQVIEPVKIPASMITILADNDYYSQPAAERGRAGPSSKPRFHSFGVPLEAAHKTGLGSSAALVTAFIGAVLTQYLPADAFSLASDRGRRLVHNLAQAAHSAAQGKVGSGFDVASACFGSCVYRRFSPSIVDSIGEVGSEGFGRRLQEVVEETSPTVGPWNMEIVKSKVTVPKGLRLVMCDVDCGSKTPGMVKKLLAWRAASLQAATALWTDLQTENDKLAAELVRLAKDGEHSQGYERLAGIIQALRSLVRDMSSQADVPVEPKAQTDLLDFCTRIPGVVGGVTPGAGGYDAVVLVVEDRAEVLESLSQTLSQWKFDVDEPGVVKTIGGTVRVLGVREESQGLRSEPIALYETWLGLDATR